LIRAGQHVPYRGAVSSSKQALPPVRQLVRARDLADAHYTAPLTVDDLAAAACLSRAHFSREFRRAFGESPYSYLLTRRLERAATLLRGTDYTVADICMQVGLTSVGSFTSSFRRAYGMTPTEYRESFPSAATLARIPLCVLKAYGRPNSTIGEDSL
jgi:AraC-like DNA-binding protein